MNPIDELAMKIEAYPNKLITKTYVLKLLRESQRHECENCRQVEHNPIASHKKDFEIVWGGEDNRTISKNVG